MQVIDFTVNGECSNCGECCSNLLPLDDVEVRTIKRYIKKHRIKESHSGIPLNAEIDMTCPFLDNSKVHKCRIYHIRPKICRFFICNKKTNIEEAKAMINCRIINMRETFYERSKNNDNRR